LYAGSGALGLEALSRGAAGVTMVEQSRNSVDGLLQMAKELQTTELKIICDKAENFLSTSGKKFDIVFLDPPFSNNLLQKTCESLRNKGHLHTDALVYLESDREIAVTAPYAFFKQARAGNVHYALLKNSSGRKMKE